MEALFGDPGRIDNLPCRFHRLAGNSPAFLTGDVIDGLPLYAPFCMSENNTGSMIILT
jgi:hypothetical protein